MEEKKRKISSASMNWGRKGADNIISSLSLSKEWIINLNFCRHCSGVQIEVDCILLEPHIFFHRVNFYGTIKNTSDSTRHYQAIQTIVN